MGKPVDLPIHPFRDLLCCLRPLLALLAAAPVLCACVAHPEPIVDLKGVDPAVYETDRRECEAYADEVSIGKGSAKGAATGAVIGAATGAITGDVSQGAGYGGIYGGAQTGMNAEREKQRVFTRCLRGRGYRVLNY
jgi:outer membrane lipoprotein SlyB